MQVDTSRFDAKGRSEGAIAKAGWKQHGLSVSTKLFPTTVRVSSCILPRFHLIFCHWSAKSLHRPGIPQISHSPEVHIIVLASHPN